MKTILQECIEIIKELVGQDYLYFDNAVEVRLSPHSHPFHVWAVCVSPSDELYIMGADEEWHRLELRDQNAALMIGSLYQRLKMIRIHYAKAS